jgi:hypothetical protein
MQFVCSICEEQSTQICVVCSKDACDNHLCEKCHACSDCCTCDVPLDLEPVQSSTGPGEAESQVEVESFSAPEEMAAEDGVPREAGGEDLNGASVDPVSGAL